MKFRTDIGLDIRRQHPCCRPRRFAADPSLFNDRDVSNALAMQFTGDTQSDHTAANNKYIGLGCSFHLGAEDKSYKKAAGIKKAAIGPPPLRSEEHTSELQSRLHLVCRLLLEK